MNPIQSIPPPTFDSQPELARAQARKLLARRRRRLWSIRKRAIAGAVAVFAAVWVAIGFQLASGHDPALGKTKQAAVAAGSSSAGSTSTSSASTDSTSTDSTSSSSNSTDSTSTDSGSSAIGSTDSSSSASSQPAPVTTRQS
jgi:cytoskeletal protein RodZ